VEYVYFFPRVTGDVGAKRAKDSSETASANLLLSSGALARAWLYPTFTNNKLAPLFLPETSPLLLPSAVARGRDDGNQIRPIKVPGAHKGDSGERGKEEYGHQASTHLYTYRIYVQLSRLRARDAVALDAGDPRGDIVVWGSRCLLVPWGWYLSGRSSCKTPFEQRVQAWLFSVLRGGLFDLQRGLPAPEFQRGDVVIEPGSFVH
jgi:hypothetical protein